MTGPRTGAFAAPLAVVAAIGLAACDDDSAGPEQATDVEDVAEADPDENDPGAELLGQAVTVSGEISEIVDQGAFRIGGDDLGGEAVTVVSPMGGFGDMGVDITEEMVANDTVLQVTGTVRQFNVAELEDEFGVDYDDERYEDVEGEAVIVADQVVTLPGETLTIAGRVSGLLSTVSFQLAGAGWTVVVLDAQQAAVEAGDYVQVQGTVRQLDVAELEEEFGTDLDDAVYEPYVGDLVLVAESVTPVEPAGGSPMSSPGAEESTEAPTG